MVLAEVEPQAAPAPDPALFAPTYAGEESYEDALIDPLDTPEYIEPQAERYTPQPAAPEPKRVVQHTPKKSPVPSKRAQAEAQPTLKFDPSEAEYECPPLSLLNAPVQGSRNTLSDEALEENARMLESVLDDYGVKGEIVSVRPVPL